MPLVVPVPLAGLATELGNLTQDLQNLEQARNGISFQFGGTSYSIPGAQSTYLTPPGWPNLSVSIGGNGSAIYIAGCQASLSTGNIDLGVIWDGAVGSPNVVGNNNATFFPAVVWFQPALGLGTHTAQVVVNNTGIDESLINPFLIVVPV
jgi:hypothetical protein